jgi:hypothetical protein
MIDDISGSQGVGQKVRPLDKAALWASVRSTSDKLMTDLPMYELIVWPGFRMPMRFVSPPGMGEGVLIFANAFFSSIVYGVR